MDNLKPWRCQGGHVMGMTMRNGRGVTQLLLYRHAVDPRAAEQDEVDVMATLEGLVMDVRCDICGAIRTWVPGEAAMRRMLERMGRANPALPNPAPKTARPFPEGKGQEGRGKE